MASQGFTAGLFHKETEKTLVAKVFGNAKMHISTKNGTMVP
jgi:hypothetical protein